jgi:hypothetical protein
MPGKRRSDATDTTPRDSEFFDILAKELEGLVGLGYSTRSEDHIWIGEDGQLDSSDWIEGHFGLIHPLENILRVIVEAHPNSDLESPQVRLEQALKALVGYRPRRGRKPARIDTLLMIARDWWEEYCRGIEEPNLSEIIRHTLSADFSDENISVQQKNLVDEWRGAFSKNKDLLLKIVSGSNSEEQNLRKGREQMILELLGELGVATARPGRG